jgi:class 3 adenylate cyclase
MVQFRSLATRIALGSLKPAQGYRGCAGHLPPSEQGAEVSVRIGGAEAMKRKIAAIMAADIAGYSKLVAEDEEETVRRLAAYRAVIDDFIAKAGGRVFNTAGDAVLAEFPSAVEAVRCAIDIQESLRTRNLAYPPSRQMNFRIGITIGDVIERDGDLLGDGVNIAARLEGLAQVGGICISRAVHEQVANKLSVQFADIGEQQVKNIPTPVYAYMLHLRGEEGVKAAAPKTASPSVSRGKWPAAIALAGVVAVAAAIAYVPLASYLRGASTTQREAAAPANRRASRPPQRQAVDGTANSASAGPAPSAIKPATLAASLAILTLAPAARDDLVNAYEGARIHKALVGVPGTDRHWLVVGLRSGEVAQERALEGCQVWSGQPCALIALDELVTAEPAGGKWPVRDMPRVHYAGAFDPERIPSALPAMRGRADVLGYRDAPGPKAAAFHPSGRIFVVTKAESQHAAEERALGECNAEPVRNGSSGPCFLYAAGDQVILPERRSAPAAAAPQAAR